MFKSYAGIGSRQTPADILSIMRDIGRHLSSHWTLRTGGADGADWAFAISALKSGGMVEMYEPWANLRVIEDVYAKLTRFDVPDDKAYSIAASYHPNWGACNAGARRLHARNVHQVLGKTLDDPVKMVICWTPEAKGGGGTGQAIRIAKDLGIPVYDLADDEIKKFISAIVE